VGNNIVIDVEKSTVDSQEVVPPRKSGRSIIEEQIELYEVQRDQSVDESIYVPISDIRTRLTLIGLNEMIFSFTTTEKLVDFFLKISHF